MTEEIPYWVEQANEEFLDEHPRYDETWEQVDEKRFTTVVAIHYPPIAMVYYEVDRLEEDGTWRGLNGTYFSQELASRSAREKAYYENKPHRVRRVVWDG